MKLLAIDTTEEGCSAALYADGTVSGRYELAPRRHSELILPMMEAVLAEGGITLAALDGLAFARGPGSFTGVRIAASVIQAAAFAADLPVVPVSSLHALAQGAWRRQGAGRVAAAFDARMQEVYWGLYEAGDDGLMRPIAADQVIVPEEAVLSDGDGWFGIGSGWRAYAALFQRQFAGRLAGSEGDAQVDARDVARLAAAALARGEGVAADQALPVYLRDQVAQKKQGA